MKIRDLLYVLFSLEKVGIFTDTEDVWSGYACAIPQEYYDSDIDVVFSIRDRYSDSCTCIYIK